MQKATVAWGKERAQNWLQILNDHWLGDGRPYVCGDTITIADYFGICLVTLGEVIRVDFSKVLNVERWISSRLTFRASTRRWMWRQPT